MLPAEQFDQLSPADRVFGWVHAQASEDRHAGDVVAYRGQLRVGRVRCLSDDAITELDSSGVPLAIMSTPKPSQASFTVLDRNRQPLKDKNKGFDEGQQLRHRKVYPHQKQAESEQFWDVSATGSKAEFRHPGTGSDQRSNQNRSVTEWVTPGTEFAFRIHVENLSQVELGALLWMLSLDQQYPDHKHFFRAGGGKPLGFGSVNLSVAGSNLRSGVQWRDYYGTLSDDADTPSDAAQQAIRGECVQEYRDVLLSTYSSQTENADGTDTTFESVEFVDAFLGAARGLDGPVHYPRVDSERGNGDENFKWFEAAKKARQTLPELSTRPLKLPYGSNLSGE